MTTKSDWHSVPHNLTEDERRKPGEPTNEELLAYSNGELSGVDAQRVRVFLAENPEMERALALTFPEDDARPGDADYLPDEVIEKQWTAMRKRIRPAGRLLRFPAWGALAAAAVAIVFAGLFWNERSQVQLITRPELVDITQEFDPTDRERGGGGDAQLLDVSTPTTYCALKLSKPERYEWYRVEIFDATRPKARALWTSEPALQHDGRVALKLHRDFFDPGVVYRIQISGVDERAKPEPTDQYLVRVRAR